MLLVFFEYLEGDFLEARNRASDTDDEDDGDQSEGRVHVAAQYNAERSGIPIDASQSVTHEASQACHYGERTQTFSVILYEYC